MADDNSRSCPSCGARVPVGADQCELCGTAVEAEASASDEPPPESTSEAEETTDEQDPEEGPTEEETPGEPEPSASDASSPEPTATDGPPAVYCNQCGHKNPREANYCSRCGSALEDLSASPQEPDAPGARPVSADLPEGDAAASADTGEAADTDDAGPQTTAAEAALGSQLFWVVGVGLLMVLAFFGVTQWSQQYEWGENEDGASAESARPAASGDGAQRSPGQMSGAGGSAPQAGARSSRDLETLVKDLGPSVDGAVADAADSLRALVDEASGAEKQKLRSELVQRYLGAGAPGRAALVQQSMADAAGTVDAKRRAADLLYRWMRQVEQNTDRAEMAEVARHVASAYEAVAEDRPDDLDARTRMGEAYLLTNSPMKGIQTINDVLSEDSTFVPARFQKGLALLQINRLDEAVQQFETVKVHADPEDPFYQQAERAIKVIRERTSGQGGSAPSGS